MSAARARRSRRGPTRPKSRAFLGGVLRVNARGAGQVDTPEGTFAIPSHRIAEAMAGDTVQIRRIGASGRSGSGGTGRSASGLPLAAVSAVLERATTTFAAIYQEDGPLRVLVPLDDRLMHDFVLDVGDGSPDRLGVTPGDVVTARISAYPTRREAGVATIERRIGTSDDEDVPIESVIASHGLATEFSQTVLEQAASLTPGVEAALANEAQRRDIRDRFLVTVDPADARDFDDAVSLDELPGGGWLLGVHIADVSHYVRLGSPLDMAARERATSVYLADHVLPMLPERLSNDLCSLRPGEDRLAMTVDLALDARGRVTGADIYPSAIRSRARLAYDEVDALLAGTVPGGREVEGRDLLSFFAGLDRVSRLRQGLRRERGAIEFVTRESKVVLDEQHRPVDVRVRSRTAATQLIEEAMLAANEAVARYLERAKAPAAFRVHEPPAADALAGLIAPLGQLDALDATLRSGVMQGDPHALQAVLDGVAGRPDELVVSAMMLRAMRKATYEPRNEGHFGLGAPAYCHFTSPIRRYPDLVVHRSLKAQLAGELKSLWRRELIDAMPTICRHASRMERVAAEAAAESQACKMAEYLGGFIGQAFAGVVVSVAPYGAFVRLDETGAEGLLHVRELARLGGWHDFDDATRTLVGADTGDIWQVGRRVEVVVEDTDPMHGRIDFALPDDRAL